MSGLSHYPGKVAQGQPCREFESLALRQFCISPVHFLATHLRMKFPWLNLLSIKRPACLNLVLHQ